MASEAFMIQTIAVTGFAIANYCVSFCETLTQIKEATYVWVLRNALKIRGNQNHLSLSSSSSTTPSSSSELVLPAYCKVEGELGAVIEVRHKKEEKQKNRERERERERKSGWVMCVCALRVRLFLSWWWWVLLCYYFFFVSWERQRKRSAKKKEKKTAWLSLSFVLFCFVVLRHNSFKCETGVESASLSFSQGLSPFLFSFCSLFRFIVFFLFLFQTIYQSILFRFPSLWFDLIWFFSFSLLPVVWLVACVCISLFPFHSPSLLSVLWLFLSTIIHHFRLFGFVFFFFFFFFFQFNFSFFEAQRKWRKMSILHSRRKNNHSLGLSK